VEHRIPAIVPKKATIAIVLLDQLSGGNVMATSYNVVLLTAHHSISGELLLQEQRLSDFLNDRRDSGITLLNTQVARLSEPSKTIERRAESVVPKIWVTVAFVPPQKDNPASKRLFGFVQKKRHEVFLIMDGMEVRGTLHTPGELELRRLLATTSDSFIPITQAVVTLDQNDRYVIEQDAIMVNAHLIRYIGTTQPKN
jgi:hypothetical protein